MSLFNFGKFKLHSGNISNFKIDCDYLSDDDIEALAKVVSDIIEFGKVIGIPRGGIRFAKALEKYCLSGDDTTLIVDDVFTTGSSMEEAKSELLKVSHMPVVGVVIFARNTCPWWVMSLFDAKT